MLYVVVADNEIAGAFYKQENAIACYRDTEDADELKIVLSPAVEDDEQVMNDLWASRDWSEFNGEIDKEGWMDWKIEQYLTTYAVDDIED